MVIVWNIWERWKGKEKSDEKKRDDVGGGYDENDDGELSFDYGQIEQDQDVSTSRNSMEVTTLRN